MNKFIIKRVEIENFRSIQNKVEIDIKPNLFTIEGRNNDETGGTNAAGKSSIFSSIYWCLTGSPLTNEDLADEIVNEKAGKNCRVTLYIDSNEGEIRILRTRKDDEFGNSLFLEINGQDMSCHKVADTQDRLNQLIKIPFDLLHSTIMMTHDIRSAFSTLTPQQRIHTLESIRDYSIWDKVRDEANDRIKYYHKKIGENNITISNLEGRMSTYDEINKGLNESIENLKKNFDYNSILNEINSLKTKKLENTTLLNENNEILSKERLNFSSDDSENQIKLTNIVDEANKLKLDNQKIDFESQNIDREIDLIEKWFTNDKCPTCGKPLDRTEEEKTNKLNKKQEYLNKKNDLSKKTEENNKKLEEKRIEWSKLNNVLKESSNEKKIIQQKISALEKNIKDISDSITESDKKISSLTSELNSHDDKLNKYNADLEKNNTEIKNIKERLEFLSKDNEKLTTKKSLSEYYYKLLGSKGELRPYLLSKDIKSLNEYVQKYIHAFFKNTEVQLVLNGSSIDIIIDSLGIKKSVSRLSGGEKKRLDLAIQFALYDLLQSTSQVKFNLVCFDEIESELDDLGIQQIIEVVEDKSAEIESVFWITNNSTVSESIPNKIICTKSLGTTTVEEI